jgi:UDP-GlcNAc:undecaprenyl-phosphate/decaprenyl-phosphate GlcNAc-1-phosphate transferase
MVSPVFLMACGVCLIAISLLCRFAVPMCLRFGLMDAPGDRKLHKQVTPLVGGLALTLIILPLLAALTLFSSPAAWQVPLLTVLAATAAMALLGMADDRHALAARDRILVSFLIFGSAALVNPLFNVRVLSFDWLGFQLGLGATGLAIMFTTLCCVGLANAVNMADGKNGLVIGLCIGWLSILSTRAPAPLVPVIILILCGLLVLFIFNLSGRLFLGDGGAYGFAGVIAMLAIMIYNSPGSHLGHALSAEELMLLFSVPVVDSFRLTFVRMRRGQSPMAADRDHLHHHLEKRLGWPGGLIGYFILALVPSYLLIALR